MFVTRFTILPNVHISTTDADGITLAAIQGLNQIMNRKNRELKQEIQGLSQALASSLTAINGLETRLAAFELRLSEHTPAQ
jgi:hypothetical protein